jgi:hypothetical protein
VVMLTAELFTERQGRLGSDGRRQFAQFGWPQKSARCRPGLPEVRLTFFIYVSE